MDSRSCSKELHERENKYECILLCGRPCTADDSIDYITSDKWESIQSKSVQWEGLDRSQHVRGNVDWKKDLIVATCIALATQQCLVSAVSHELKNAKEKLRKVLKEIKHKMNQVLPSSLVHLKSFAPVWVSFTIRCYVSGA